MRPSRAAAVVFLLALVPASAQEKLYVADGASMRYVANAGDPGIGMAWTQPGFDDSTWASGEFGVGYETQTGAQHLIETPVPAGTRSIFARVVFDVTDVSAVSRLSVGADYDDGVVFWLNGQEIHRSAEMPAGPLTWNSTPTDHESSNGLDPSYDPLIDISATGIPLLHNGTNVLAVGVWNTGTTSSDLVVVPLLVGDPAWAIVRGPYLQTLTPTSVRVRWRTWVAQDSRVVYGTSIGSWSVSVTDPTPRTEHEVLVANLVPGTRYYYAIGTTTVLAVGNDERHFFVTPPAAGTRTPLRIWVLGDSGTADANSRAVRDAYLDFTGSLRTNLWLMLGDNAYPDGTDANYQDAVFDVYPDLLRNTALWPTIGNHDALSADSTTQSGPYYDIFSLPTAAEAGGLPSGTEAYYSFDYANIHFVVLDSQDTDRSPGGAMLSWLDADLAATAQDWIVAYWHHPPYSEGSHDSDTEMELIEMRENALPILEAHGVDLVLTGHSHGYERSFLIDGHYGASSTFGPSHVVDGGSGRESSPDGFYLKPGGFSAPHAGAVYTVAGNGGSIVPSPLAHPAMYFSTNTLGSVVLDVDGLRLDARMIDPSGVIQDEFTIVKGSACPSGPDADGDGVCDAADNCPTVANEDQANADADGLGDACDPCPSDPANDVDGDGVCGNADNCPTIANAGQANADADGLGDACDPCPSDPANDADGDGICGNVDNCPTVANAAQTDADGDGAGDVCDACPLDATNDFDGDGTCENADNCPGFPNPAQTDTDGDGRGDACDACPLDLDNDADGDGICGDTDNCPGTFNPNQADEDQDGLGDACDVPGDIDGDGVIDRLDNCPTLSNPLQTDTDKDRAGDACDADDDGDSVADTQDCAPLAAGVAHPPGSVGPTVQLRKSNGATVSWLRGTEGHLSNVYRGSRNVGQPVPSTLTCVGAGTPLLASAQPEVPLVGAVQFYLVTAVNVCGESVLDEVPQPPTFTGSCPQPNADSDGDGVGDLSDNCVLVAQGDLSDVDHDFVGDVCDNCPTRVNPSQADANADGRGDACASLVDRDNDGIEDAADNCPDTFNTTQVDIDLDHLGDVCDACPLDAANDADADGRCANVDNCPNVANPAQADGDGDGTGNACDGCPTDANKIVPGACGCGVPQCWIAQSSGQSRTLWGVAASSDSVGHAVGENGTLLVTSNGGATWTGQFALTVEHFLGVDFPVNASTGYAVGGKGVVLKTTNGGSSWVVQLSGTFVDLLDVDFPVDAAIGWVVGRNGTIRKTTNGGMNWTAQSSGTGDDLHAVHFPVDASVGYVVGKSGVILRTTNGGSTWTALSSGTSAELFGVHFVSNTTGFVVGEGGVIRRTTNGGVNWSALTSGTSAALFGVQFVNATTGYVVGDGGVIRKTTNGGTSWTSQPSGTSARLLDVQFAADALHGWTVGEGGVIRRSAE